MCALRLTKIWSTKPLLMPLEEKRWAYVLARRNSMPRSSPFGTEWRRLFVNIRKVPRERIRPIQATRRMSGGSNDPYYREFQAMKKRVLIISTSAGTGHVAAAAALEKAFRTDPRVGE